VCFVHSLDLHVKLTNRKTDCVIANIACLVGASHQDMSLGVGQIQKYIDLEYVHHHRLNTQYCLSADENNDDGARNVKSMKLYWGLIHEENLQQFLS